MIYILVWFTAWLAFFILLDRNRFRELYPTALIGMIMSLTSDVVTNTYPLWFYTDPQTHIPQLLIQLLDDFGIYPVIAYLYTQYLPSKSKTWFFYTLCWTIGGIGAESLLVHKGFMIHQLGWCLGWSYLFDWIIFGILTSHYHAFLKKRTARESTTRTEILVPQGELLGLLTNYTCDGIVLFNLEARIVDVNPVFCEMVGWSKTDLIGRTHPLTPQDELPYVMDCFRSVASNQAARREYQGKKEHKDGKWIDVTATLLPVKDQAGNVVGVLGIARPIQTPSPDALKSS